jgi:hypothetical protein
MITPKKINKKGAIPILSSIGDAFSGVFEAIKSILDIIPRPVKIILFFLIILLLGNLIIMTFRMIGFHCNSANLPMKVTNLLDNSKLIQLTPDYDNINLYGDELDDPGILFSDVFTTCSMKINNPIIESNEDGTETQLIGDYWFYDGNPCNKCPEDIDYRIYRGDGEGNKLTEMNAGESYCYGDVYRTNISWWVKTFFCSWGFMDSYVCRVPEHHYYDSETNIYVCDDETCANITIGDRWDIVLKEAGAKPLYPLSINVSNDKTIERAIGISCVEMKPRLSVFGIDIFNYQYWVLGLVIAFMIWVAINLKDL